ncbi:3-hydroxyisobutyryl-CoA hydrolase [Coemansia sp. RSA 1722]|nr:3-hydroxyisobutyryl-CoA hydrolase [Coemansia sp. RSA 485]KAJ2599403.1 3-hydroxyisobutyryl-CoA hydrolase [Coemansia sp. RSA 1722]
MAESQNRISSSQSGTRYGSGLRNVFSSRLVQDCSSGSDNAGDSNGITGVGCRDGLHTLRGTPPGPYRRFWATESPSGSSFDESQAENIHSNIRPRPRRSSTAPSIKTASSADVNGDADYLVVLDSEISGARDLDRALVNWGVGNGSDGRQVQRRMGIPGVMDREHQSRVLFVSLLENYCQTYDDDPLRNRRLFFAICRTLFSMGIIGKEYVDEMAAIRSTYSDAFRQLVAKAQESLSMYEHYDIESGIRSLMTGVEEESSESYEMEELSEGFSDMRPESPVVSSDDDSASFGECRRYATVPASRSATWLAGPGRLSVNSLRSSTASSRGFASATAASFRESNASTMRRGRNGGPYLGHHRCNLSRLSRGSVSVSPGATFGTMVMDMQRSRYHDDFVQLRCLGKGGFGKVYEVRNKLDGRRYAVKLIKIKGEITADKTLREIKTLANLDHPNIVRYYSSWIEVTRVRQRAAAVNGSGSARSFSFRDKADGVTGFADDSAGLVSAGNGSQPIIYADEEAAVVAQVSIGHSSVPKSWSAEAASNIVFEQSGEGQRQVGEESIEAEEEDSGGGDDQGCESDGVVFCEDESYDYGVVFAYEEPVCPKTAGVFPRISSEESDLSSGSCSSDIDSDVDSESECSADCGLSARASGVNPIPIGRPPAHRRRRSVHAPVGPFTPSSDSANHQHNSGRKPARNGEAQSLPSQSMDLGAFLVAETTLFVQMQLCQTTLQEFLSQRNARISERLSHHQQHVGCTEECELWGVGEPSQLIDPVLNVRLFRSIVEAVKYFHTRGVIHRDLKGANVFLDIVYADSGGNPLSRSASGIGRPSDSSLPQTQTQTQTQIKAQARALQQRLAAPGSVVPAAGSGLGSVHSDAWDAIDGGNLKERPDGLSDVAGPATDNSSRKIDWDAVFESMLAPCGRPAPMPGFGLSASSSSSSWLPAPGAPKRLQREGTGAAATGSQVTFIPRIGDFGLATKATLGIRSAADSTYAFIGQSSNTETQGDNSGPSSSECRTSNVGTITYAAPEQLGHQQPAAASGYNEKADIYSLGIIFFELYHAFSTAMERVAVIKDLRQGVFPADFVRRWPKEAALILRMMDPDADKRPSARDILAMDLIDVPSLESAQLKKEVMALKHQLYLANQRNEELGMRVRELERIVDLSISTDSKSDGDRDVLTVNNQTGRTLVLNRPKALNSLTSGMVHTIKRHLEEWRQSDLCDVVILRSNSPKAFCAGGDVVEVSKSWKDGDHGKAMGFFQSEYQMNHLVAAYEKPLVALIDGYTMGGGVGLSVHAAFRVATERSVFAMPETRIGFFPDVGATFFLSRMDGQTGVYLGLTGSWLRGRDLLYAGVATHYVASERLPLLEKRLQELGTRDHQVVNQAIEEFATQAEAPGTLEYSLADVREAIDRCFRFNTVEAIVEALKQETQQREWATKTLETLGKMSPSSLKLTLEQLRNGPRLNIQQALSLELRLAEKRLGSEDMHEGIDALLVSKTNAPKWTPATLEEVDMGQLHAEYFESSGQYSVLDFIDPNVAFDKYPHAFGLPSERDIGDLVTGVNPQAGSLGMTRREVLGFFDRQTMRKVGVRQKVSWVLDRKTEEDKDSYVLRWIK